MSTEAFGETLQFITTVKLHELEKRRLKYTAHASKVIADANAHGDANPVARLTALVKGMNSWNGAWSSDLKLDNITRYLNQARRDPGFPRPVLDEWIRRAEAQIAHEGTRYEYAQLFGNLLTDWLKSKSPHPTATAAGGVRTVSPDNFEKVGRKETLEQKKKLESLIFETKEIDVDALEAYLEHLFSSKEAREALADMRSRIEMFANDLRKREIQTKELEQVIHSVLQTDVLSDKKQATLKKFLRNPTVLKELASVLNMQLSSIKTWHWPQEGVLLEPRRQLNGRIRFFLDAEILTCLLLHYLGMLWAIKFKEELEKLLCSSAWKQPPRTLTRVDHKRRDVFFKEENRESSMDGLRRKYQREHLFMCQLPSSPGTTVDHYKEDAGRKTEGVDPRFDTPVNLKQSLLHILSADIVMNKALHGQCTVVRTDLEWFGPSLPFATITTVLRFFGMPNADVKFIQAFLSCPIVFKGDPSGLVRTRSRGVPITYMLSTLCGELVMFVMDFAVNQKADGLFLHRIHDDFWLWDSDASRCAAAWTEMQRYATVAGLTFNAEKTGSVAVGRYTSKHTDADACEDEDEDEDEAGDEYGDGDKDEDKDEDEDEDVVADADAGSNTETAMPVLHPDLPLGDVRWGFLRMDADVGGKFVIDQAMIDEHVVELRRQLAATTSAFGWAQAYNKYMAFIIRNCGAPAIVYGESHIDEMINTVTRIQKVLFSDGGNGQGSFADVVGRMIEVKFGTRAADIPYGWYLWPNAAGGLEVKDPLVDLFLLRDGLISVETVISLTFSRDRWRYEEAKERWENGKSPSTRAVRCAYSSIESAGEHDTMAPDEPFFSFEEFTKGREERSSWWRDAYAELLERPKRATVKCSPQLEASLKVIGSGVEAFGGAKSSRWSELSAYWQWVIGLHHDEMVKKFGSLAVVEPTSVPVGMVSVFKQSRMRWEQ